MMVRHICPILVFFTNASTNKYFLHTSLFIGKNLMIKGGSLLKVCVFIKSFLLCATILIFCSSNSFSRQQVLTTTYLDDVAPSAAIQCCQLWPKMISKNWGKIGIIKLILFCQKLFSKWTSCTQYGNFVIFLSLRFYVKSSLRILKVQTLPI